MQPTAEQLKSQLRKFNLMGYSDQTTVYESNGKSGKLLTRTDNDWKYEDEFYGGEPYSGNETMWFQGNDVFRCVYWGKVQKGVDFSDIYAFLQKALKGLPTGNCVHRGPEKFSDQKYTYTNECTGDIEEFVQIERIFLNNTEVYKAYFIGGRINVQKE